MQSEQYINRKHLGAHYTTEDISEYIAKNSIIPAIFDAVEKKCPAAFGLESPVWRLLHDEPDRYIYEAVRCEHYLPTETEQEYMTRRKRYRELEAKLVAGEITSINELITYNLDIHRFAEDVIKKCEAPELPGAFYESIQQVTVLDPTCGDGAFLLAALDVLRPLYQACLERLQPSQGKSKDTCPQDRTPCLEDRYPTQPLRRPRPYEITKAIILNNLYGVDMMEAAVEICKQQLFLKLVAQAEWGEDMEPVVALDFNIRVGNMLVGWVNDDEVPTGYIKLDHCLAQEYGVNPNTVTAFEHWRASHQPFHWCLEFPEVMKRGGFDVIIGNPPYVEYAKVKIVYHVLPDGYRTHGCGNLYAYCIERSMKLLSHDGRWGMIVPLSSFATDRMHSLQQFVMERLECLHISFLSGDANPSRLFEGVKFRLCIALACKGGVLGNPVGAGVAEMRGGGPAVAPTPLATANPGLARSILPQGATEGPPPFPTPPPPLRGTAASLERPRLNGYYSTKYVRWYAEERDTLFSSLQYCQSTEAIIKGSFPKIGQNIELALLQKMKGQTQLRNFIGGGDKALYYHNCPVNWIRATTFVPAFRSERDGVKVSSQLRPMTFASERLRDAAVCIINSTLFFWFWLIYSDCYHLTERELGGFPINLNELTEGWGDALSTLCDELMRDYKAKSRVRTYVYKTTGTVVYDEFYPKLSKPIIDEIDRVLARHYGFTDEELDFILNYEIKYRMGQKQ